MAGSTFGKLFSITTWGESHGPGLGAIIDGCPAGLKLEQRDIQKYLNRRRPGQGQFSSPRTENDFVVIYSGIMDGMTTGTPISLTISNTQQNSAAYSDLSQVYRPGHADYTYDMKYGIRDYRGGGRASGRETAARVAGGAIALKLLDSLGIRICTYTKSIGPISIDYNKCNLNNILSDPLYMPDAEASSQATEYISEAKSNSDSVGGIVECIIQGVPAGLGQPVFDKLDAELAKAVMSIGAVKGFEIGDGFHSAFSYGSQNNDSFCVENGQIVKRTNNSGGVLGGISDGSEIIFRAAIKPTPSIAQTQNTVNSSLEEVLVNVEGRHDPVIVPRAVVVVEAMAALTIADMYLINLSSKLDNIKRF